MVKIQDLAKICGVSTATVSYALNGKGNVSEETRQKVRQKAEELGYVPSQAARSLKQGKSNVIGIIIPEITSFFNNQIFNYLEKKISSKHLSPMVGCSFQKVLSELDLIEKMIAQSPMGIIWFPTNQATEKTFRRVERMATANDIPVVVIYPKTPVSGLKYLSWNVSEGMEIVTGYLLDQGKRRVLFFGNPSDGLYASLKYEGYLRAFEKRNLTPPEFTCNMGQTYGDAQQYTTQFLEAKNPLPDGIVAVNDIAGYGILNALESWGIKVPEYVSVVGIDGVRFAYSNHQITTATPNLQRLAETCVNMISHFDQLTESVYFCENIIIKGTTSD